MVLRAATHAGSWYSDNPILLKTQIDSYFSKACTPLPGTRILIGPHAGYRFCGQVLAQTYTTWDPENVKRIIMLGPSHHVYFRGSLISGVSAYDTPFGQLQVDTDLVNELEEKGIKKMSLGVEEDEHSFEMHLPFLYKAFENHLKSSGNDESQVADFPKIVPIMVGHTSHSYERKLASLLAPYVKDPTTAFVISTDFIHWGGNFNYTNYTKDKSVSSVSTLGKNSKIDIPIYKSIEYMDKKAMDILSTGSFDKFNDYVDDTDVTICGRKPLSILLALFETMKNEGIIPDKKGNIEWLGYAQSSKAKNIWDNSVSYASGVIQL